MSTIGQLKRAAANPPSSEDTDDNNKKQKNNNEDKEAITEKEVNDVAVVGVITVSPTASPVKSEDELPSPTYSSTSISMDCKTILQVMASMKEYPERI